jgi:hypothetical protein
LARHNDGNCLGRILGSPDPRVPPYHDYINFEAHKFGREVGGSIEVALSISVLDGDVLSFCVAKLAQGKANWLGTGGISSWTAQRQIPDPKNFLWLLRLGEIRRGQICCHGYESGNPSGHVSSARRVGGLDFPITQSTNSARFPLPILFITSLIFHEVFS